MQWFGAGGGVAGELFEVVLICYFQIDKLEQNNASKQKVGHCDQTTLQIVFIFIILNSYVSLILHAKIQSKISCGSGEVHFVVFCYF